MKNKLIIVIALTVFAIILVTQQTAALGITPGRKTVDFEPGKELEVPFSIINSEGKDTSVVLQVRGDLNESITLDQRMVELSSDEEEKQLNYKVNLPNSLEEPGTHEAEIVALEIPKDAEEGKFVGATVSVTTQLHVNVPYPGKYLEFGDITIDSAGEEEIFYIPLENKGQTGIESAEADIEIYNPGNELVGRIKSESISINKGERGEIVAEWANNETPGKYRAEITITYDGKTVEKEKNFEKGEASVKIESIDVEEFELGEVAKFNSMVKNNYNEEMKNSFILMKVFDESDNVMADIKSRTYNIPSRSKKNMVAYWDTAGIEEGSYRGKVTLNHSLGSFEKEVVFDVKSDDIVVQGIGGEVIAQQAEEGNLQKILIIAVIALAVLNIVWFAVIRKILNRRGKSLKSIFVGGNKTNS